MKARKQKITEERIAQVTEALKAIHHNIAKNGGKAEFVKTLADLKLASKIGTAAVAAGIFHRTGRHTYGNSYEAIEPILARKTLIKARAMHAKPAPKKKVKKVNRKPAGRTYEKHTPVPNASSDRVEIILLLVDKLSAAEKMKIVSRIFGI